MGLTPMSNYQPFFFASKFLGALGIRIGISSVFLAFISIFGQCDVQWVHCSGYFYPLTCYMYKII
jgi:hypothetical protein